MIEEELSKETNPSEEISSSLSLKDKFLSKKEKRTNTTHKQLFSFIFISTIFFLSFTILLSPEKIFSPIKKLFSKINEPKDIEKSSFFSYIDKVTHKKVRLSYILTKNPNTKKVVILCHGMFSDKNSEINFPLLEGLIPNWSVIRFDFEGNGESSGEWSYADYPREVRNIGAMVNYAENILGLEVSAIIGHSKAGADVFIAASDPELIKNKNCCFISMGGRLTFGKPEKRFTEQELDKAKVDGYFMWKKNGKMWKITQDSIKERKEMNPKEGVKNIDRYRAERILQIHGTKDTNTPIEEAYVIEKEIPGAQIKWIQDANHFFEGKEKEMAVAVVDWLKSKIL